MGSENLFHDRRKSSTKLLARKIARRDAYDRVLIVCEGKKTEPNYLRELIDHLKLNSANVEIDGNSGSSPHSVWTYARKCHQEEIKKGDAYDRVYCVIDRDSHSTYNATVEEIRVARPRDKFYAITSIPCFEYWILLHFEFVTRPYNRIERKSPCDSVISELKEKGYVPDYTKGDKGIFTQIMMQTDQAIAFSKRSLQQAQGAHTDNPTTLMHELIEYLRNLK